MINWLDYIREQKAKALLDKQMLATGLQAEPELGDDYSDDIKGGFSLKLKKKRRSAMLRQMLEDSGYTDLAKMITNREQGD